MSLYPGIRKTLSFIAVFLVVLSAPWPVLALPPGGLPAGGPTPGIKPPSTGAPAGPRVPLPEGPQIRHFTATSDLVLGEPVTLSWQVDPSLSGSRVAHVSVLLGETVVEGNLPPGGSREVRLVSFPVGATSVVYTLRATDAAGKISGRSATVRLISPQQALRQLDISLQSEPREFRPGQPIDFKVGINSEIWPMRRLKIDVTHGGRVVGGLSDFMIRAQLNHANLRDAGFTGEGGDYTVTIEYMGQRISRQFRTYAVPMFSLAPASR